LRREFGADVGHLPASWQIDPFGHSSWFATFTAKVHECVNATSGGGNASAPSTCIPSVHYARSDYRDYGWRAANGAREMLWTGSSGLPRASIFAENLVDQTYGPPNGFDFSGLTGDVLHEFVEGVNLFLNDDVTSPQYNIPRRVAEFQAVARHYASVTRRSRDGTTHVMVMMGSDFEYEVASSWFVNADKLVKYVNIAAQEQYMNGNPGCVIEARYSTPEDYVRAKAAAEGGAANLAAALPKYVDADLFPYADGPSSMWTGYFASRPSIKRMITRFAAYSAASN
jgi:alpha-mannosidase